MMFPPVVLSLFCLVLFLLCLPLGKLPLPFLALEKSLYLREQDTGKSLYGPQFSGTGFGFGKQIALRTSCQEQPSPTFASLL